MKLHPAFPLPHHSTSMDPLWTAKLCALGGRFPALPYVHPALTCSAVYSYARHLVSVFASSQLWVHCISGKFILFCLHTHNLPSCPLTSVLRKIIFLLPLYFILESKICANHGKVTLSFRKLS